MAASQPVSTAPPAAPAAARPTPGATPAGTSAAAVAAPQHAPSATPTNPGAGWVSPWSELHTAIALMFTDPDDTLRADGALWAISETLGDGSVTVPKAVAEEIDRLVRAFVRAAVHEGRGIPSAIRLVRAFVTKNPERESHTVANNGGASTAPAGGGGILRGSSPAVNPAKALPLTSPGPLASFTPVSAPGVPPNAAMATAGLLLGDAQVARAATASHASKQAPHHAAAVAASKQPRVVSTLAMRTCLAPAAAAKQLLLLLRATAGTTSLARLAALGIEEAILSDIAAASSSGGDASATDYNDPLAGAAGSAAVVPSAQQQHGRGGGGGGGSSSSEVGDKLSPAMREFLKEASDALDRLQVQGGSMKNPKREQIAVAATAMHLLRAVVTAAPDMTASLFSKGAQLARVTCGFPDESVRSSAFACLVVLLRASQHREQLKQQQQQQQTTAGVSGAIGVSPQLRGLGGQPRHGPQRALPAGPSVGGAPLSVSHAPSGGAAPGELLAQVLSDFRQADRIGEHGLCGLVLAGAALVRFTIDKQRVAGLLAAVVQAVRHSNSQLVRATFVAEAGVFAAIDGDASRVDFYISAVMQPLATNRKLNTAHAELRTLAAFIDLTKGSDRALPPQHKNNIEAFIHRALQLAPAPEEAWDVAAAFVATLAPPQAAAFAGKLLQFIGSEQLSLSLSRAVECLIAHAPRHAAELRRNLAGLVERSLQGAAAQLLADDNQPGSGPLSSTDFPSGGGGLGGRSSGRGLAFGEPALSVGPASTTSEGPAARSGGGMLSGLLSRFKSDTTANNREGAGGTASGAPSASVTPAMSGMPPSAPTAVAGGAAAALSSRGGDGSSSGCPIARAVYALRLLPRLQMSPADAVAALTRAVAPLLAASDPQIPIEAIKSIALRAAQCASTPALSEHLPELRTVVAQALRRAVTEPDMLLRHRMLTAFVPDLAADDGSPDSCFVKESTAVTLGRTLGGAGVAGGSCRSLMASSSSPPPPSEFALPGQKSLVMPRASAPIGGGEPSSSPAAPSSASTAAAKESPEPNAELLGPCGGGGDDNSASSSACHRAIFKLIADGAALTALCGTLLDRPRVKEVGITLMMGALRSAGVLGGDTAPRQLPPALVASSGSAPPLGPAALGPSARDTHASSNRRLGHSSGGPLASSLHSFVAHLRHLVQTAVAQLVADFEEGSDGLARSCSDVGMLVRAVPELVMPHVQRILHTVQRCIEFLSALSSHTAAVVSTTATSSSSSGAHHSHHHAHPHHHLHDHGLDLAHHSSSNHHGGLAGDPAATAVAAGMASGKSSGAHHHHAAATAAAGKFPLALCHQLVSLGTDCVLLHAHQSRESAVAAASFSMAYPTTGSAPGGPTAAAAAAPGGGDLLSSSAASSSSNGLPSHHAQSLAATADMAWRRTLAGLFAATMVGIVSRVTSTATRRYFINLLVALTHTEGAAELILGADSAVVHRLQSTLRSELVSLSHRDEFAATLAACLGVFNVWSMWSASSTGVSSHNDTGDARAVGSDHVADHTTDWHTVAPGVHVSDVQSHVNVYASNARDSQLKFDATDFVLPQLLGILQTTRHEATVGLCLSSLAEVIRHDIESRPDLTDAVVTMVQFTAALIPNAGENSLLVEDALQACTIAMRARSAEVADRLIEPAASIVAAAWQPTAPYFIPLLDFLAAMDLGAHSHEAVRRHLPTLLAKLTQVLSSDVTSQRMPSLAILRIFKNWDVQNVTAELVLAVFPAIFSVLASRAPSKVKAEALATTVDMIVHSRSVACATPLLHVLRNGIQARELDGCLRQVIEALESLTLVFPEVRAVVRPVHALAQSARAERGQEAQESPATANEAQFPRSGPAAGRDVAAAPSGGNVTATGRMAAASTARWVAITGVERAQNLELLPYELSHFTPEVANAWPPDEWRRWFRSFSHTLIGGSPAPAIRACTGLSDRYSALRVALFAPALMSHVEHLPAVQMKALDNLVLCAIRSGVDDVVAAVLAYLDLVDVFSPEIETVPTKKATPTDVGSSTTGGGGGGGRLGGGLHRAKMHRMSDIWAADLEEDDDDGTTTGAGGDAAAGGGAGTGTDGASSPSLGGGRSIGGLGGLGRKRGGGRVSSTGSVDALDDLEPPPQAPLCVRTSVTSYTRFPVDELVRCAIDASCFSQAVRLAEAACIVDATRDGRMEAVAKALSLAGQRDAAIGQLSNAVAQHEEASSPITHELRSEWTLAAEAYSTLLELSPLDGTHRRSLVRAGLLSADFAHVLGVARGWSRASSPLVDEQHPLQGLQQRTGSFTTTGGGLGTRMFNTSTSGGMSRFATGASRHSDPAAAVSPSQQVDSEIAEAAASAAVLLGRWDTLSELQPSLSSRSPLGAVLGVAARAMSIGGVVDDESSDDESPMSAASMAAAKARWEAADILHDDVIRGLERHIATVRLRLARHIADSPSDGTIAETEMLLMVLGIIEEVARVRVLSAMLRRTATSAAMAVVDASSSASGLSGLSGMPSRPDSGALGAASITATAGRCALIENVGAFIRAHRKLMDTGDPDKLELAAPTYSPLLVPIALSVAGTVVPHPEQQEAWLLCAMQLRGEFPAVAQWAFERVGPAAKSQHRVAFGKARYLHAIGDVQDAIDTMKAHICDQPSPPPPPSNDWAAAHLSLNRWLREVTPAWWRGASRDEVLALLRTAIHHSGGGMSGSLDSAIWRNWALFHYRVPQYVAKMPEGDRLPLLERACTAFVNAIAFDVQAGIAGIRTVPDTLRLLQVFSWLGNTYGSTDVGVACVDRVPVACWAHVAPQLVAQLSAAGSVTRLIVVHALRRAVAYSSDAVVFPLWMAAGVDPALEKQHRQTLETGQAHSPTAPDSEQAALERQAIAGALARSVLDAAGDRSVIDDARAFVAGLDAMFLAIERVTNAMSVVRDLTQGKKEGPAMERERHALRVVVNDTAAMIRRWTAGQRRFDMTRSRIDRVVKHFSKEAWDFGEGRDLVDRIYGDLYRALAKDPVSNSREVDICGALRHRGFNVVAPGDLDPARPQHRSTVVAVEGRMQLIQSKRKPRRAVFVTSDGRRLSYLLKSFEDLRVDERVMQLFRLVNSQLSLSDRSHAIVTYAVVPLLPTLGLIGWINGAQTLVNVIHTHRRVQGVSLHVEADRCNDEFSYTEARYLTRMQREELYEWTLSGCKSNDISRVLWLRSHSSARWLAMRRVYTDSMALNSVVGYTIGLGDRHPDNLMLLSGTGRIAHIDFGDCFDRARFRLTYPEPVPFRLTRMLTNAMELTGPRGTFASTAERSLQLLRNSRDSVVGLLGALVYDPTFDAASIAPRRRGRKEEPAAQAQLNLDMAIVAEAAAAAAAADEAAAVALGAAADVAGPAAAAEPSALAATETTKKVAAEAIAAATAAAYTKPGTLPGPSRIAIASEGVGANSGAEEAETRELLVETIRGKLRGADGVQSGLPFHARPANSGEALSVPRHVDALIREATSLGNISQVFTGWCPLW